MPAAFRVLTSGDKDTGHGGFPPRGADEGSPNVYINNFAAVRKGDHFITHCYTGCHDSILENGSSTVFVNGKNKARFGDRVACGGTLDKGSPNVFVN
jgi:uncharacterized Zn-binding protein involved in type VI secretion